MLLPITTLTAIFLTVLYVYLSLRVINLRRTGRGPSVGLSGDEYFTRAVRAHGNLGEYAPLFLILLGLYEIADGTSWLIGTLAIIFCLSRLAHAIGFGYLGTGPWRTVGMVGTNTCLLITAGLLCVVTVSSF